LRWVRKMGGVKGRDGLGLEGNLDMVG
jgi:hypothetical protein